LLTNFKIKTKTIIKFTNLKSLEIKTTNNKLPFYKPLKSFRNIIQLL
jgi:hypothetical protein